MLNDESDTDAPELQMSETTKQMYERRYERFDRWRIENNHKTISEAVLLAYFKELSAKMQPPSLWAIYSMIKRINNERNAIKISNYTKLARFLNKQQEGYKPKKSEVFTAQHIQTFLKEAPDHRFLMLKVIMIFGVNGGLRGIELVNIRVQHVEKHSDTLLLVKVPSTKTNAEKTFVIRDEHVKYVEQYQALRPSNTTIDRFFLQFIDDKCRRSPVGINQIGAAPRKIATYLKLPNPERYTGHCFRRTAASLLATPGPNLTSLKQNGECESNAPTEDNTDNSNKKISIDEDMKLQVSTSAVDPLTLSDPLTPPGTDMSFCCPKEEHSNNFEVDMSVEKLEVRAVTYMCPTHPVQYYELILELLEEAVGCYTTLQYESRVPGPAPGRPDPFENDKVDLAFMTAAAYLRLRARGSPWVELLPVTPVFAHQMNVDNRPGYFCDVIMHADKRAHNVNTLLDLRGCAFAYSHEESLSGCKLVLKTLKEKGENASFFGSQLASGSHWASAQMVLTKQAEWAAVDSTTLLYSKKFMQDGGKDITILETLGRLPPYPIVVNSRLPDETKQAITDSLLKLPLERKWKKQFAKFGVIKFETNSNDAYDGPAAQMWAGSGQDLNVRYY